MKFKEFYKDYILPLLAKIWELLTKHTGVAIVVLAVGGFAYETISYTHILDESKHAAVVAKSDTDKLNSQLISALKDASDARADLASSQATIASQQKTLSLLESTIGQLASTGAEIGKLGADLDEGQRRLEGLIDQSISLGGSAIKQAH